MALRADSYGSLAEVAAFTRHVMRGQSVFNSTTYPTATEVEKMLDRVSGTLNVALRSSGLAAPVTNTTAKLDCDNFAVSRTAAYVESTIRGAGSRRGEENRGASPADVLSGLHKKAKEFVKDNRFGFIELGVTQAAKKSRGLTYTGLSVQADRTDPDDTSLEQPKFKRGLFENKGV